MFYTSWEFHLLFIYFFIQKLTSPGQLKKKKSPQLSYFKNSTDKREINKNHPGVFKELSNASTPNEYKYLWGKKCCTNKSLSLLRREKRDQSCQPRSWYSFLAQYITEQGLSIREQGTVCPHAKAWQPERSRCMRCRLSSAGQASLVQAPALCLLVSSGTRHIHSVSVTPTGTISSLMVAFKSLTICT